MSGDVLDRLAATIRQRRGADAAGSYTKALLDGGTARCARKFGEEAVEAVIAAIEGDRKALTAESADVLFHLLVLLEASDITLEEVARELEGRMHRSGHAEKASRPAAPGADG